MPIPTVTPYPGEMPAIADPITFDARMTEFAAWFEGVMTEVVATVAGMNTALNDNGTVLDATAQATRRATNAVVPALTTGTGSAYVVAASVTIPALVAGEPVAVRIHTPNAGAATLNVNGLGAIAIRKIDGAGQLVALSGGELGAFDEHVFVYDGTFWALQTQPLRELVAGPVLQPLSTQNGDFDLLLEGGEFSISGSWSNGPSGSGPATYAGFCHVIVSNDFALQVLFDGADTFERRRVGSGGAFGDWQSVTGVLSGSYTATEYTTAERQINVAYQNLTNKPIFVSSYGRSTTNTWTNFQVSPDGTNWFLKGQILPNSWVAGANINFEVLPGWYWRYIDATPSAPIVEIRAD